VTLPSVITAHVLSTADFGFGRPYLRSRLWYKSVSVVSRLSVSNACIVTKRYVVKVW